MKSDELTDVEHHDTNNHKINEHETRTLLEKALAAIGIRAARCTAASNTTQAEIEPDTHKAPKFRKARHVPIVAKVGQRRLIFAQ
jgi:hypothetical protein